MDNKYKKDKKITILKYEEGVDDNFLPIDVLKPMYENIWCYYRHLSGKELSIQNSIHSEAKVLFVINYRKNINTDMMILYNGDYYNITEVDDYEGKKTDLKLYASLKQ